MLQYNYRPNSPPVRRTRTSVDQEWVDYDPIVDRPPLRWPGGARLALLLCPGILDFEFMPPEDPWLNPWARTAAPDVLAYCRQEFGNRVGFWRVIDAFDRYNVRATAVINVDALKFFPDVTKAAVERKWDFLGHGISNTRFIFNWEKDQERAYYREMLDQVEDLTGVRMKGMGGAGPQVATEDTVDLLAEAGFLYQSDWSIDDQPFPLRVKSGKLIAMPYPVEINDVTALSFAEADDFFEIVKAQFDRLYAEGAESGRVMTISLHPPLIGQPQRIRYLEKILDYIMGAPGVWQTTGAELAEYYMTNYYDSALARLDSLRAGGVR